MPVWISLHCILNTNLALKKNPEFPYRNCHVVNSECLLYVDLAIRAEWIAEWSPPSAAKYVTIYAPRGTLYYSNFAYNPS